MLNTFALVFIMFLHREYHIRIDKTILPYYFGLKLEDNWRNSDLYIFCWIFTFLLHLLIRPEEAPSFSGPVIVRNGFQRSVNVWSIGHSTQLLLHNRGLDLQLFVAQVDPLGVRLDHGHTLVTWSQYCCSLMAPGLGWTVQEDNL